MEELQPSIFDLRTRFLHSQAAADGDFSVYTFSTGTTYKLRSDLLSYIFNATVDIFSGKCFHLDLMVVSTRLHLNWNLRRTWKLTLRSSKVFFLPIFPHASFCHNNMKR